MGAPISILFRDNFPAGGPINQIPTEVHNKVFRILNNLKVVNSAGAIVGKVKRDVTGRGWAIEVPEGGGSATDASSPWAATVTGAAVSIAPGYVLVMGKQGQLLSGTLVVSGGTYANPNWIVCLIDKSTGAPSLVAQASPPNPANATHIEWPLHQYYMASGTAVILRVLEKGVIFVGNLT